MKIPLVFIKLYMFYNGVVNYIKDKLLVFKNV